MNKILEFKNKFNIVFNAISLVFFRKKYFLVVLFSVFLFLILPNFLINLNFFFSKFFLNANLNEKIIFILGFIQGGFENNTFETSSLKIMVGVLFGIIISMLHFKYLLNKKLLTNEGFFGTVGGILGLFFASCGACSLAIISFFGGSFLFVILPFGGIEMIIISILLLLISIYLISNSIVGICKNKI